MEYERISAYPTKRQLAELRRRAKKEGRKPAELVRAALEWFLFSKKGENE